MYWEKEGKSIESVVYGPLYVCSSLSMYNIYVVQVSPKVGVVDV